MMRGSCPSSHGHRLQEPLQQGRRQGGKEANELRFDDKKGNEYIWFHAERDFHRQVEHDAFDWVGNNESVHVTLTRKEASARTGSST
jgi:uncharacterized protein involved in type VI secretion and phage assembly